MMRADVRSRFCAFALVAALVPRSADAAPDAAKEAAESFRQAEAAFARRDYRSAAAAWEQAAAIDPHPATLLNAADAWERAGEWVRAAEDCDRVLAIPSLGGSFRTEAERQLTTIAPRVATIELRGPDAFTARIDGGAALSLPGVRRVSPGRHRVVFQDRASAAFSTSDVELAPGETRLVDAAVKRDTEPPAPPSTTPARPAQSAPPADTTQAQPVMPHATPRLSAGSWIGFAAAGSSLVVTAIFGVMTLSDKSNYDAHPTSTLRDDFHRDKAVTNVSIAVAGASVLAGLALVRWNTAPSGVALSLGATRHAGGGRLFLEAAY
jgi:hypothetical protein